MLSGSGTKSSELVCLIKFYKLLWLVVGTEDIKLVRYKVKSHQHIGS